MRKTSIFSYHAFGYNYFLLREGYKGERVREVSDSLLKGINEFFSRLEELDLQVTKMAAGDLSKLADELTDFPEDATVDDELAERVSEAIDKLDATLDAELQLRSAYIVTPKRFPLEHLLTSPKNLFASKVFQDLPAICQYDFSEAGRCIAFALPTATVFHLMRGTEGVLRWYYCSIVKRNRVKTLLWNAMVTHLRKRRAAPPEALLDNLDSIRRNFRNPTQHPDARYDLDGAQDLLGVAVDAVNRMVKDVKARSA